MQTFKPKGKEWRKVRISNIYFTHRLGHIIGGEPGCDVGLNLIPDRRIQIGHRLQRSFQQARGLFGGEFLWECSDIWDNSENVLFGRDRP